MSEEHPDPAPPPSPAPKAEPERPRGFFEIPVPVVEIAFVTLALVCVQPWISPAIALALGLVLALAVGNPFPRVAARGSKLILQVSVAMLGFRLQIDRVLEEAMGGALFAIGTIAGTLTLGYFLGRRLEVAKDTTALVSGGTAICGGSAIAAMAPAIGASPAAVAISMAIVFVLNGVALFLFPPIGHLLGLSDAQFGTWAGVGIHDVSSVVGAARAYSDAALETATTVKLVRALWIVPVAIGAGYLFTRHYPQVPRTTRPPVIPWFIAAFLVASCLRSFVPGLSELSVGLSAAAKSGLSLTLFLIGTNISLRSLREVGPRAFALGVALWLAISVVSLLVVLAVVT